MTYHNGEHKRNSGIPNDLAVPFRYKFCLLKQKSKKDQRNRDNYQFGVDVLKRLGFALIRPKLDFECNEHSCDDDEDQELEPPKNSSEYN